MNRCVYVISDLHLGGREPAKGDPGFRMMPRQKHLACFIRLLAGRVSDKARVELVIAGDFVDFLAEEYPDEGAWSPFWAEPGDALQVFKRVLDRPGDREVFEALGALLAAGGDLTVMLGNHDLELSLPEVRAYAEEVLGARQARGHLRWVLDNEALLVGDTIVEHGNRYDRANRVDHDRLRALRSARSRWRFSDEATADFKPPPGSTFVAEVMNPLKRQLPFIDLLKPESEPLFALVLALKPEARDHIFELVRFAVRRARVCDGEAGMPRERAHIASHEQEPLEVDPVDVLLDALGATGEERAGLAEVIREEPTAERAAIGAGAAAAKGVLAGLVTVGTVLPYRSRLALVRRALKVLAGDDTFDRTKETNAPILAAAEALGTPRVAAELGTMPHPVGRVHAVVFGHTHHAKQLPLESGATYLNTGTWAELMRFPPELLAEDDSTARAALEGFAARLRDGDLAGLTRFEPTYVRIDVDTRGRSRAALYDYDWEQGRLNDPA